MAETKTDQIDCPKHGVKYGYCEECAFPRDPKPEEAASAECSKCFHEIEAFVQMCPEGGTCTPAKQEAAPLPHPSKPKASFFYETPRKI